MPDSLLIKTDSNIAKIEINRPDHANAIDEELWIAIGNCFSELDESNSVRVCIISGVGNNFTSGIDLHICSTCHKKSTIMTVMDERVNL